MDKLLPFSKLFSLPFWCHCGEHSLTRSSLVYLVRYAIIADDEFENMFGEILQFNKQNL